MKKFYAKLIEMIVTACAFFFAVTPIYADGQPTTPYSPYSPYSPHVPVDTAFGFESGLIVVAAVTLYIAGTLVITNASKIRSLLKNA